MLLTSCLNASRCTAIFAFRNLHSDRITAPQVASLVRNSANFFAPKSFITIRNHSTSQDSLDKRKKLSAYARLMRLDKPTGTALALTPALWAIGLATPDTMSFPDIKTMSIFTAGAVVARGMGCTINDILDRKYDSQVERTKTRPIACGEISVREALVFLAGQSAVGLYILCLNNVEVIKMGFASVGMMMFYPLFKRFNNLPQLMLGATINMGVFMGYLAVKPDFGLGDLAAGACLYFASICWTLYYDTVYALQDKEDDLFIGLKSTAISFGGKTKTILRSMVGLMTLNFSLAGVCSHQTSPYFAAIFTAALIHAYHIEKLDLCDKKRCGVVFDLQKYIGILIWSGVLLSVARKAKAKEPTPEVKHTESRDE